MSKTLAVIALLVCGFLGLRGHAMAAAELCPARIVATHGFTPDRKGALYDLVLAGSSARTVRGEIVIDTNVGYLSFDFPDTVFTLDRAQYRTPQLTFERDRYVSNPLYVLLPSSVTEIKAWWVTKAQTTGETVFAWDARGSVTCPLGPIDWPHKPMPHSLLRAVRANPLPYDLTKLPSPADPVMVATITSAPGDTSCAVPFTEAAAVRAVPPVWPIGLSTTESTVVLVRLAIAADGSVTDATIYQPSTSRYFDDAAFFAAKRSIYKAAISFCQAVPGMYLFSSDFNPH